MEEIGWWHASPQDPDKLKGRIGDLRMEVDQLDEQIIGLLSRRLKLACQIGDAKRTLGLPVSDQGREEEIKERIGRLAPNQRTSRALVSIYASVIAEAKKVQTDYSNDSDSKPATPVYFPDILIVGMGLIGGVLARQIRKIAPSTKITAVDRVDTVEGARKEGIIDRGLEKVGDELKANSLILLAAPPAENIKLLKSIAPHLKQGQVVLDVGSTKREICELANRIDLNGADFVGGHPLVGSEKSGWQASAEINPEGHTFVLVPAGRCSEIATRRLFKWLESLRFKVRITDARVHDDTCARLSHLIQLVATGLGADLAVHLTDRELEDLPVFAGPAFRQMARLMDSPGELWTDIIMQNDQHVIIQIGNLCHRLKRIENAIARGDRSSIKEHFRLASGLASRINHC